MRSQSKNMYYTNKCQYNIKRFIANISLSLIIGIVWWSWLVLKIHTNLCVIQIADTLWERHIYCQNISLFVVVFGSILSSQINTSVGLVFFKLFCILFKVVMPFNKNHNFSTLNNTLRYLQWSKLIFWWFKLIGTQPS